MGVGHEPGSVEGGVRFDRESWRKLYRSESPEDRLLPVAVRGVRDYLIRYAKDDGTLLESTTDPGADMARVLGAHPDEFDAIKSAVERLFGSKYLSHKKGRLWITKFREAQEARSPNAARQLRYREKRKTPREHNESVTSNATPDAHETLEEKRREEKRREREKVESVFEHWQRVRSHPKAKLDAKRKGKIEARLRDGFSPDELCRAIDNVGLSAFHCGDNDRHEVFDDIVIIFRDAPQVEKFRDMATAGAGQETKQGEIVWAG